MTTSRQPPDFATLVRDFFTDRLVNQQNVSPHTVAAYRDTFRLLLAFVQSDRKRPVKQLTLDDLSAPTILAFLNDLETTRGNTVRTRNARLAAIRAFVSYAASRDPSAMLLAQCILAIPRKRFDRPLLGYLTRAEVEALLAAVNSKEKSGRRDHVLFHLMYNTGIRVSEAIGIRRGDILLTPCASVRIRGKGRKERSIPLWKTTVRLLAKWLPEIGGRDQDPVFPNRFGQAMSRSGVENRLKRVVSIATATCPSLAEKSVSPHTIRHTTAMHLLQSGVDVTVIALWLGHENLETTHHYMEADLEMKRRVLDRLNEPPGKTPQQPKGDGLLDFLNRL
jgi:integrase/recombinase XerD